MIDNIFEQMMLRDYINKTYFITEYNGILRELNKTDEEIDTHLLDKYVSCEDYCFTLEQKLDIFLKNNIVNYNNSIKFSTTVYHYVLSIFYEYTNISKKNEALYKNDFLLCILYNYLYKKNQHKIEKLI